MRSRIGGVLFMLLLGAAASTIACGGSGQTQQSPPPISLSLVPNGLQTVDQNQTKQFAATVNHDSTNKGVTWTLIQNGASCSPQCGTISPTATPSGQPATYTAPVALTSKVQFQVTATSVADATKSASDKASTVPPPVLNIPAELPDATAGQAYSYQLIESGGVPPYAWSVISGSLPNGLQLNSSTGVISGTPTSQAAARKAAVTAQSTRAVAAAQVCFTVQLVDSGNPPLINNQQICINLVPAGNPVPSITLLTPASAPIGAGPLSLTIDGSNFVPGATVGFGSDTISSNILVNAAGTQIIVTVPAADLSTAGSEGITVTNPSPGGGTSNTLSFNVSKSTISVSVSLENGCGNTLGSLPVNGTCYVYAKVTGESAQGPFGVSWSVDAPAGCAAASCGTIVEQGRMPKTTDTYVMLYFGPDTRSSYPPMVTLKATSVADPSQSNSAPIALAATSPLIGVVSPLISANAAGTTGGSGNSGEPVLNLDGSAVAFTSAAQDLGYAITQPTQVFWKGTCVGQPASCMPLGTMMLAYNAVSSNGGEGNAASHSPSISGSGGAVGFLSGADNLDPNHMVSSGGAGQFGYIALACGPGHCSVPPPRMVSVGHIDQPGGTSMPEPDNAVGDGSISPDGRIMVFSSSGEILGQTTFPAGIYLGDGCTTVATPPCVPETVSFISNDDSGNPLNPPAGGGVAGQLTSGGGADVSGFVVFPYPATSQVEGPANGIGQIYERDLGLGRTIWVSQDNNGNPAPAPWGGIYPSVSSDGRFVSFISSGLAPNDTNGLAHLYVRDTCLGVASCTPGTTVVDIATVGANAGKASQSGIYLPNRSHHAISADGRYVVFESTSADLGPNAAQGGTIGVYVRDMSCTTVSACPNAGINLVSLTSGGTLVGDAGGAAISGDGHYVVFQIEESGYGLVPSGTSQVVLALTGF
jgi:hypothetical protein